MKEAQAKRGVELCEILIMRGVRTQVTGACARQKAEDGQMGRRQAGRQQAGRHETDRTETEQTGRQTDRCIATCHCCIPVIITNIIIIIIIIIIA